MTEPIRDELDERASEVDLALVEVQTRTQS
jgi:hypothetical protein